MSFDSKDVSVGGSTLEGKIILLQNELRLSESLRRADQEILKQEIAARDTRIKQLEDAIKKLVEISHRDGDPTRISQNFMDLFQALTEAEKVLNTHATPV